jgi:hypothetical protein
MRPGWPPPALPAQRPAELIEVLRAPPPALPAPLPAELPAVLPALLPALLIEELIEEPQRVPHRSLQALQALQALQVATQHRPLAALAMRLGLASARRLPLRPEVAVAASAQEYRAPPAASALPVTGPLVEESPPMWNDEWESLAWVVEPRADRPARRRSQRAFAAPRRPGRRTALAPQLTPNAHHHR